MPEGVHTQKQRFFHNFVVFGTFASGILYIVQNGRKFIDDSTRFVWLWYENEIKKTDGFSKNLIYLNT